MGAQVKETPKMAFLIYVGNPAPKPTGKQEEFHVLYIHRDDKKDWNYSSPDYKLRGNLMLLIWVQQMQQV